MKVLVAPGQILTVGFCDKDGREIDGDLLVEFTDAKIEVRTDWSDSTGRVGIVYQEVFTEGFGEVLPVEEDDEEVTAKVIKNEES